MSLTDAQIARSIQKYESLRWRFRACFAHPARAVHVFVLVPLPCPRRERKTKAKSSKSSKKAPPDEFDDMNLEQLQERLKVDSVRTAEVRRNRNYYQQGES
jgi:hypothetical protein